MFSNGHFHVRSDSLHTGPGTKDILTSSHFVRSSAGTRKAVIRFYRTTYRTGLRMIPFLTFYPSSKALKAE